MHAHRITAAVAVSALAAHASASITDLTVRYSTSVGPLLSYDANFDPTVIGDENFDVTGGSELLAYTNSAAGGDVFLNLPWSRASVNASGQLNADGGFDHAVSVSGQAGGFFDIPNSVAASMTSTIEFTIDQSMDFELLLLNYNYNNDAGSGGFDFRNTGTNEVYTDSYFPGQFSPDNPGVITGTIGPGSYRLVASTNYGISQYGFTLTPTPGSAALLGMCGILASRRRR